MKQNDSHTQTALSKWNLNLSVFFFISQLQKIDLPLQIGIDCEVSQDYDSQDCVLVGRFYRDREQEYPSQ